MIKTIKSIEAYRPKAQKGIKHDELFGFIFLRPLSLYFSWFLYSKTTITANAVTYFMFVLSFSLPIAISTIKSEAFFYCLSGGFFLVLFLDQIDGELARLRGVFSEIGYFFDLSLWFTLSIWSVLLFYRLEQNNVISDLALWSLISLEFVFLYLSVFDYMRAGAAQKVFNLEASSKKMFDKNEFSLKTPHLLMRLVQIVPQKNLLFLLTPLYFYFNVESSGLLQLHLFIVFTGYFYASVIKINIFRKLLND
jgi:phosphatidylglycerophosphate synthase